MAIEKRFAVYKPKNYQHELHTLPAERSI